MHEWGKGKRPDNLVLILHVALDIVFPAFVIATVKGASHLHRSGSGMVCLVPSGMVDSIVTVEILLLGESLLIIIADRAGNGSRMISTMFSILQAF